MEKNTNFKYINLSPFKWFVLENFPFLEADFDALTEWQLFCKLGKEINKIIESQNIVGKQAEELTNAFNNLQNYVNDYFDNLDVQEEINNKLNEMATNGQLQAMLNSQYDLLTNNVNNSLETMQNQLNALQSGSPDGVYATLQDLIQNDPAHNRIYIVEEDGKWYFYDTVASTWKAGGIYQATQIQNRTIKPEQTTFLTNNNDNNIFNYPDTSGSINGVNYELKNGVIRLNGIANGFFELAFHLENVMQIGQTYSWDTFTRDTSWDTPNSNYMARLFYGPHSYLDSYQKQKTFVAEQTNLLIHIYATQGTNVNNVVFMPKVVPGSNKPQYFYNNEVYLPINKLNVAKSLLVVAKDGTGDFMTIQEAVDNAGDTPESPVTIYIKPGIYEESIAIREKRNLSFIGTNVNDVIWINKTGKYGNCPLYINGAFNIENITFKMTLEKAGNWVPTWDINNVYETYTGYAIHIDYYSKDPTVKQYGRLKNCIFYSEANASIGMGLHQNQYVTIENCKCITKTPENMRNKNYFGGLLCHNSQENETNQNLILKDSIFYCNWAPALYLKMDFVSSSEVKLTAINNTIYSDTDGTTPYYIKGTSILTPLSHGNNSNELNS